MVIVLPVGVGCNDHVRGADGDGLSSVESTAPLSDFLALLPLGLLGVLLMMTPDFVFCEW